MAVPQNQQQAATALVEEKFFNISLGQNGSLIKQALEEAAGLKLEELAPGMWTGSREVGWGSSLEITARAQAVEEGTSVELRVEHRSSPGAVAAWIFLVIAAAMVLLPLIPLIMWGTKLGVQFSLALVALKALPVLILGGFTSIPGAIIGGLIIGAGEKIAEVFWGPAVGGAIEDWFAYMLALVFLVFRPQGLFGEKIIERV